MRSIGIVLVAVCGLAAVTGAFGQGPVAPPASAPPAGALIMRLEPRPCALMALRFLRPSMMPRLTKDLSLTDEQVGKVTDLLAQADVALKPKIEDQRKATAEFVIALAKPDGSQTALVAAFEKAMKAETEIAEQMIKTMLALRGLLTDQQKAAFTKVLDTWTDPWKRESMRVGPVAPMPLPTPTPAPSPPPVEQPKAAEPAK